MTPLHRPLLTAAALLCAPVAFAQSEWDRTMLIYALGTGFDGDSQIGATATSIDQGFSDILDNMHLGGLGSFTARNDEWAHTIEASYTELQADETLPSNVRVVAEFGQTIASYDIGYRIAKHLEVLGGIRYTSVDGDIGVILPSGAQRGSGKEDWFDPYVGLNSILPMTDRLDLVVRADIGGFDVGSKLTWQTFVRVDWKFSDAFFASAGYRIIDTDYEDGSGADYFKYDIMVSGPGVGIGWRFQ